MKTFCPLPWIGVSLRNNGDLRICCNANSYSKNKGILRKKDGSPYNAGYDDIGESRNSELLKEVRASMLKDQWHPECRRCMLEEQSGVTSRRQLENNVWPNADWVVNHTTESGTIDRHAIPIKYFDIRYGNFCNLKCRMCGPTDSHTWYSDHVQLSGKPHFVDADYDVHLTKNKKGKWSTDHFDWFKENQHYWDQFDKYTQDATMFYIVGGEPLIIDEHAQSLQKLIDGGRSKYITLEYNTNLTNVTQRMLDLWKHFKVVKIGASIDGFGKMLEYQRAPANWESVYQNMVKLNNNRDINFVGWFAFTVTTINVFHLPDFIRWKLTESNLDRFNSIESLRSVVNHHLCHSPKIYNIKVLPDELKLQVDQKYQLFKQWALDTQTPSIANQIAEILDGVSNFMNSESYYDQYWSRFVEATKELDQLRDQSIVEVEPRFEKYFR